MLDKKKKKININISWTFAIPSSILVMLVFIYIIVSNVEVCTSNFMFKSPWIELSAALDKCKDK